MNAKTKHTYDHVFQHPISHNLEWHDVKAMFEHLGEAETEHNGNLKVTMAGESIVFQTPNGTGTLNADQVSQIQRFIRLAEKKKTQGMDAHLLVVIDHQEARVFKTDLKDSVPEHVTPHDPDGHGSHVHSSHAPVGDSTPQNHDDYFEEVGKKMAGSEKVLIFGSGKGSSNAMDGLVHWLKQHDSSTYKRVIGTVAIDQSHKTDNELLATAREFYVK